MTTVQGEPFIYAPFRGIYPKEECAELVIAPPYDVLSSQEAKERAKDNLLSFLHISKAEIDFGDEMSMYDDKVYEKAAQNFKTLLENKILQQSDVPSYYIYQIETPNHIQTGLAVAASVKAYREGRIRRHELTRPIKEDDRVRQIRAVGAQTGPALLINKPIEEIKSLFKRVISTTKPLFSARGDYQSIHRLWEVSNQDDVCLITECFAKQNKAYIADGHHRSAAAARLSKGEDSRFLAVTFFADEMTIMDYNRVVYDLNGLSECEFLDKIREQGFLVEPSENKKPEKKGVFCLYLKQRWYKLRLEKEIANTHPVESLDVSVLSRLILDNVLGIKDLRNSLRIGFIGGVRGVEEIEREVDEAPCRAGFMLYPTQIDELIEVAEQNMLMPPKSTWFEPKLADGVICLKSED